MLPFLVKASVLLMILWAFYKLVIERESFYGVNRIYLIGTFLIAGLFPFISLPQIIDDQGLFDDWLKFSNKIDLSADEDRKMDNSISEGMILEPVVTDNKIPVDANPAKFSTKVVPSGEASSALPTLKSNQKETGQISGWTVSLDFLDWLMVVYWFGVGVLMFNLFAQIFGTLFKAWSNSDQVANEGYIIVNSSKPTEPCSFFKYIFIHPDSYDFDTYEQIIDHEKIHVNQNHSIDLILAEIGVALFWFNPLAWLMRKEVEKNIEYQTDDLLVQDQPEEKANYQLNLLKIATYNKPLAITTNYNQSLLKQRIMKMNSKKSHQYSYWKYVFVLPILMGSLLILNKPYSAKANSVLYPSIVNEKPLVEHRPVIDSMDEKTPKVSAKAIAWPEMTNSFAPSDTSGLSNYYLGIALIGVIVEGQVDLVKILLDKGADPNFNNKEGWTPLMECAKTGTLEIAQLLIEKGAKVNEKDQYGRTALWIARNQKFPKLEQLLADHGALMQDPDAGTISSEEISFTDEFGHSALLDSISQYQPNPNQGQPVDLSVKTGVSVTKGSINGQSFAVKNHSGSEHGLQNGSISGSVYASNNCANLILAVQTKNVPRIKELLDVVDLNCVHHTEDSEANDEIGPTVYIRSPKTALVAAARVGDVEIGRLLLEAHANIEWYGQGDESPLMAAAAMGHLSFVRLLVENGASIHKRHTSTESPKPLLFTSTKGHTPTYLEYLMSGIQLHPFIPGQGTAITAARRNGQDKVVKYLERQGGKSSTKGTDIDIEYDSEVDLSNENNHLVNPDIKVEGCQKLLIAVKRNKIQVVKELLTTINPDCTYQGDGEPRSPLVAAARNGFLEIGKMIVGAGGSVEYHYRGDESPLMAAAKYGHLDFVKFLVEQGAKINKKVSGGGTALLVAAGKGHTEVVAYLIEKGAEVNAAVRGDGTPLIVAVKGNHYETAKVLLQNGADPYLKVPGDEYAMYHARVSGDKRMIELLKKNEK